MGAEIRVPGEEHREQIARLLSRSMNFPVERALQRVPHFRLEDFRCSFDGDRLVGVAAEYHFLQWFGGRAIPTSGIWGVATLPEQRESGLASAAIRRLLDDARERGDPLTALFPAVLRPYRRLGYELAGTLTRHRVPLDGLPAFDDDDLPRVELADIEHDLDPVKRCYREWVRTGNGPIEPTDDRWWTKRIFDDGGDDTFAAVVVRDGDAVTGFATFKRIHERHTLTCRSASSARRSPRSLPAPSTRCSRTSAGSEGSAGGSSGRGRRRIPTPCWSPSRS